MLFNAQFPHKADPMSHSAFDFAVALENLPSAVTAVSFGGTSLYVALADCTLLTYEVSEHLITRTATQLLVNSDLGSAIRLKQSQKNFSKKPLQQITALHTSVVDMLVTLTTDGTMTFNHTRTVLKNVSLYTLVMPSEYRIEMAVSLKKRILMWVYDVKQDSFVQTRDFTIVDTPKTITFCGASSSICLGFKKEFLMMNTEAGDTAEVFSAGMKSSCTVSLEDTNECLLARDHTGFSIGPDGKPTRKYGISWNDPPYRLLYSQPYVLAMEPSQIEVHLQHDASLVQTIPIRSAWLHSQVTIEDPVVFIVSTAAPANQEPPSNNSSTVWMFRCVPITKQIEVLVTRKKFDDALRLCQFLPPLEEQSSDQSGTSPVEDTEASVHLAYAMHLFKQGQFDSAMGHFLSSKVDSSVVLSLFSSPEDGFPSDSPEAVTALIPFLTAHHGKTTENDNALLACYLKTKPNMVKTFLRFQNKCDLSAVEHMLLREHMVEELVFFLAQRGLHSKALHLLMEEDPHSDHAGVVKQVVTYCREHDIANMDDDLMNVLEFLHVSDEALEVLMAPSVTIRKDETLGKVRSFLSSDPSLLRKFCEHYVHERKHTSPDLHNELILIHLAGVTPLLEKGNNPKELAKKRRELQDLLARSDYYVATKVLIHFPRDALWEERALVLARMGAHEDVLHIYAHILHRHELVERYCIRNNVFRTALEVYLKPQFAKESMPHAMSLLSLNFQQAQGQVSFRDVLAMCPEEVSVNDVLPYFDALLTENEARRKEQKIQAALWKQENQRVREMLCREQARLVRVMPEKNCSVCKKRIGTSVFAVYPNNDIVHFSCIKQNKG